MTNKDIATVINLNTIANAEETRMWVIILLATVITESELAPPIIKLILWVAAILQMIVSWMSRKILEKFTNFMKSECCDENTEEGE